MEKKYNIKKITSSMEIFNCLNKFIDATPQNLAIRVGDLYEYSKKLSKNAHNILMLNDNSIIGFCSFYVNNHVDKLTYLTYIAVDNEYKKMGIGTKLLNYVIENSISAGMIYIELEVDLSNINAINFYRKMGFFDTGIYNKKTKYMRRRL